MNIVVTGGTGFLGVRLVERLMARGDQVTVLTRGVSRSAPRALPTRTFRWDPMLGPPSPDVLAGADAVVNLLGESIAKGRWTAAKKARIRASRVTGTHHLVEGLARLSSRPGVLVSGSAIGFYGDRGDEMLDESSGPGAGFLSEVCGAWEAEAERAASYGVRVALVRTGIVLAREGGALKAMLPPFRLGLGGIVGSGAQWMSWIHREDLVGLIMMALDSSAASGPLNGTAPEPVPNRDFARALGRALHRPAVIPTPAVALRLLLGEMAQPLLLEGQRVIPRRAMAMGFRFRYPLLHHALEAILPR